MKLNALTKLALVVLAGAALKTSAYAQNVLLTVDISNPASVVIAATGNNASTNDSSKTAWDGIDLLGIFLSNVYGQFGTNAIGGTLIGGGSGQAYDFYEPDGTSGRNANHFNLNLYENQPGSPPIQSFSTGTSAFTGSMTIDLSSVVSALPSSGASGDIRAGWFGNQGAVIGQWQVVYTPPAPTPEPGTLALAGLGGVGAWFYARRKK